MSTVTSDDDDLAQHNPAGRDHAHGDPAQRDPAVLESSTPVSRSFLRRRFQGFFTALTPGPYIAKDVAAGLVIPAVVMGLIFSMSLVLGFVRVEGAQFELQAFLSLSALTLLAAGLEELEFRFVLLNVLSRLTKPWIALAVTSVAFGLAHAFNDHATWLSVISNGLGGLTYGLAFLLTGRIWFPWALHFSWNWVQGAILGFTMSGNNVGGIVDLTVTDFTLASGGLYGPEGGAVGVLFRFAVIALLVLWALSPGRGARIYSFCREKPCKFGHLDG